MKKIPALFVSLILLLGVAAAPASPPSPLDRFTPDQRAKLAAGEAIFMTVKSNEGGTTQGHGQSVVVIKAPVADCYRIFTDYNQHAKFFPRKTKSQVLKTAGNVASVQKEFNFYGFTVKYVMTYTADPANYTVKYKIDPAYPHDIEDTAGFFKFEKIDDRTTLFTYAVTRLKTGVAVPSFIQSYISSRDLPAVAANVKKRVESKGTWVKSE